MENARTAAAWARNMDPGSAFSILTYGRPGTVGVLVIGPPPAISVPLDGIGASGCSLYVQPQIQLAGIYPPAATATAYGALQTEVQVPAVPSMLRARLLAQGVDIEATPASNAAGLTTTNGLDITLAGRMPPGSLSTVRSAPVAPGTPFPDHGRVAVSRGPVLQLLAR